MLGERGQQEPKGGPCCQLGESKGVSQLFRWARIRNDRMTKTEQLGGREKGDSPMGGQLPKDKGLPCVWAKMGLNATILDIGVGVAFCSVATLGNQPVSTFS